MTRIFSFCLIAAFATLVGCASGPKKDETAAWDAQRLYAEAQDEQAAGNLEKASRYYEKLEGRAAGTPLAEQAMLDAAYMHHKAGESGEALAILNRFELRHPTSPATDYALYLRGLTTFNDNLGFFGLLNQQDLSERDQKAARDSFEAFRALVVRFPQSRYAEDARQRMQYIVNSLAQSEINVARHYYQRQGYVAAINRVQEAITNYPKAPALELGLYIMVKSYDALNMPTLRDDTQRVLLKSHPKTPYLSEGLPDPSRPWWRLW
jgi:outer membrane protein assembly factor BamD